MALQASYGLMVPGTDPLGGAALATAFSMLGIDATAEKIAYVFRLPKTGTIGRVGIRTGTVVVGDTVRVSLQDVDATTGDPDGTQDQYRDLTIQNADDNVWFRTGLITSDGTDTGTKRSVTAGQWLAIVVEFPSFVAGNLNLAGPAATPSRGPFIGQCYMDHFTAAWAKSLAVNPCFALEYDDGSFAFLPGSSPVSNVSVQSLNTGTTPDEAGLRIVLPYTAQVWGAWYASNHAQDFDVVLYDAANNVVGTASVDKDIAAAAGGTTVGLVPFSAAPILTAGLVYRLVMLPTTGSSVTLAYYDVERAGILDQLDGGQAIHWTQRTDAGAWTETTTRRASMGLILAGLDDGASGGGGLSRARVVNAGGI